MSPVRLFLLASVCLLAVAPAAPQVAATAPANKYQKQIDRFFPGFQILGPTEFWKFIDDKNVKRSLITGKFNNDELEDFAALIRSKEPVRRGVFHTDKWDYHDGQVVVCHGAKGEDYQCIKLGEFSYVGGSPSYLKRRDPGPVGCWDRDAIAATDIIEQVTDVAASAFFWQPDGTYRECVTGD
jgi:hypothetical protein